MTQIDISAAREIIGQIAKKDVSDITAETTIKALPIDSLDLYSVISELENATGRTMDDDQLQALKNVGDLAQHFYG